MASLKDQLEKANTDLLNAGYVRDQARSLRKDTRYGKFKDKPQSEKDTINEKITTVSKKYNVAKKYYDNILAAYNKELENKKITGQKEGLSEADQAADLGITVAEYRKQKQDALDAEKAARDAATGDALDQQSVANYSQLLNTISADEVQLKSVQEDLRKNFPSLYKGGITGLTDWTATQTALQSIEQQRRQLPKNLQGNSLREFLLSPTIDITTGAGGLPEPFGTQQIFSRSVAEGVIERSRRAQRS